jgi:hypothetical protein
MGGEAAVVDGLRQAVGERDAPRSEGKPDVRDCAADDGHGGVTRVCVVGSVRLIHSDEGGESVVL